MNLNITTLIGAGAIAATFLFGGSAVLDSTPTANAKPKSTTTSQDPYSACRSEGGTMARCCDKVGGSYTHEIYTTSDGKTAIKETCTYSVEGRQNSDSSTAPGTPGPLGPVVRPDASAIAS